MEISMEAPWKAKIRLLNNPVIPLLSILPMECDIGYDRATCAHMFFAALFIISKVWKQPRCSMTDEWIKKRYMYTMEFCSAITKHEIMLFAGKLVELENFMLSKVSQAQKVNDCMFFLICGR
jgi:hypothetical protein